MKDFNETMQSIFEKGDAVIAEKNRRRTIVRRIGAAAAEISAAAVICIGLAKSDALRSGMDKNMGTDYVSTTTTAVTEPYTEASSETEKPTEIPTETTANTPASETVTETAKASSKTSAVTELSGAKDNNSAKTTKKTRSTKASQWAKTTRPAVKTTAVTGMTPTGTARPANTTAADPPSSGANAVTTKKTRVPIVGTTAKTTGQFVVTVAPVKTTRSPISGPVVCTEPTKAPTESPVKPTVGPDTPVAELPDDPENIRKYLSYYKTERDGQFMGYSLLKENNTIEEDGVDEYLETTGISYEFYENGKWYKGVKYADVYSIKSVRSDVMVALKFDNIDGYYIYNRGEYGRIDSTFGLILSDLCVSEDDLYETADYYFLNSDEGEAHAVGTEFVRDVLVTLADCKQSTHKFNENDTRVVFKFHNEGLNRDYEIFVYSNGLVKCPDYVGRKYSLSSSTAQSIIAEVLSAPEA